MATVTQTQYTQVELLTLHGPEFRRVSTAPPRLPTEDEIPIIDLSTIDNGFEARRAIAAQVKAAAESTGFFYIKNHGISEELLDRALSKAQEFFGQTIEQKELVSNKKSKHADGFHGVGSTQVNKTETRGRAFPFRRNMITVIQTHSCHSDRKETFSLRYNPINDPTMSNPESLLSDPSYSYGNDEFLWEGTSHIPGFRETTIEFWQRRLTLARKMIRIFALALDMPEDYFDSVTTNPGADGLYVHYPGCPQTVSDDAETDVGIGSHTDIQCVTLLWQDMSGGLQVLSASDEWLDARPIPGTLVVNIGDFLQRLSNNRFKSTVHRVYNRQTTSRYSMPFFLGFNPDSVCKVVPSCVDEDHPALYEPISCGKVGRFLTF
jgi:isopenicillin N synthase-like dioxygenase